MESFSIGEIARTAGLSASTLRYYERLGLLSAPQRKGGKRRYDNSVLPRLALIKVAKEIGFDLHEVKVLVHGIDRGDRSSRNLKTLASTKLPEIEKTIQRAQVIKRVLRGIERCKCPSLDECMRTARRFGLVDY